MKGVVRLDRSSVGEVFKTFVTNDGSLLAPASFSRDGVLEYHTRNGLRRELRPPETNKKAVAEFGLTPITMEHPPNFVSEDTPNQERHGITLTDPTYKFISGKGGFVTGRVMVWGREARDALESREAVDISSAYKCDTLEEPGIWTDPVDGSKHPYDAIQINLRINHHAITKKGRAGSDVQIHLDSDDMPDGIGFQVAHQDSKEIETMPDEMLKLKVGAAEISVSSTQFAALGPYVARADSVFLEVDDLRAKVSQIDDLHEQLAYERARADALDVRVANAEVILDEHGYLYNNNLDYTLDSSRADMAKKEDMEEKENMEEKEDMKHSPEEEEGDEEDHEDSVLSVLELIAEVDSDFINHRMDAIADMQTADDAMRTAVGTWRPAFAIVDESGDSRLDSMDEEAVARIFEIMYQDVASNPEKYVRTDSSEEYYEDDGEERADSSYVPGTLGEDYSNEMEAALGLAGRSNMGSIQPVHTDSEFDDAWSKPLALSLDAMAT